MACFSQQDGSPKASNNPTAPSTSLQQPTHHRIDLKLFGGLETGRRTEAEGEKKVAHTFKKKEASPPFSPLQTENRSGICVPGLRKHIRRGGVG